MEQCQNIIIIWFIWYIITKSLDSTLSLERKPFITSNFTLFPQYTNGLGYYKLTYLNYSNSPIVAIIVYKLTYMSIPQV